MNDLTTEISPEIINSLVLTGDMSKLTPAQQTQYYGAVCKSLNLNPLTQPFAIMVLNGKKILYARKDATQQLSNINKISTEIKNRQTQDSVYIVSVRAMMPGGRYSDEDGIVSVAGIKGLELANAMMKASTKAKRRAVLALCGLGLPDETEIEDTPNLIVSDPSKSRLEAIIDAETAQEPTNAKEEPPKEEPKKQETETKPKANKKTDPKPVTADKETVLPKGHKVVIGLIDNQLQGENGEVIAYKTLTTNDPKTGKPVLKHSFLIEDKRYGTFDQDMANKILECVDNRRKVRLEYTERKSDKGNILNDIVGFRVAIIGTDVDENGNNL